MRKLFPIFFATLTVSAMTCAKAHFVHEPDGSVAGRAAGGASGVGGAAGGNQGSGGIGSEICQLDSVCPGQPGPSPTDPCDPVCQSGCPANQRCQQVVDPLGNYSLGCETPPTGTPLDVFKPCDTGNDLCKPGLLCVEPPLGSTGCVAQCYRYCRQNSDCPANSRCALSIVIGGQPSMPICAPPAVTCNPALQTAVLACSPSLTGSTCYVFSKEFPDETMCDCAGTIAAGLACTDMHSCVAGYECTGGKCQKVCLLQAGGLACPGGQTCASLNGSTKYGTCL